MALIPTVRVKFNEGPMRGIVAFINAEEFDPKVHELFVDPKVEAEKPAFKINAAAVVDAPKVDEDAEAEKFVAVEAKARAEVAEKAEKENKRKESLAKAQAAAKAKRDAGKAAR